MSPRKVCRSANCPIENCATNAAAKQVLFVIPAEAGIQNFGPSGLDSRVRGNDETALWLRRDQ
jgi:hypothetical protein